MDKTKKYIDNVPVYQDNDFKNYYVKFTSWLEQYEERKIKISSLNEEQLIMLGGEFEEWAEMYELTPHFV